MSIEARIRELGIELPAPFVYPSANRTGCVRAGGLLFTSGHPPPEGFGVPLQGKVGGDIDEDTARNCARATALNILASVRAELGTLDAVARLVKVTGMVNSAPGFTRQFAVIDGASDLFVEIFGPEKGQHARSAVGMFELPRGFAMEIEAVFELAG